MLAHDRDVPVVRKHSFGFAGLPAKSNAYLNTGDDRHGSRARLNPIDVARIVGLSAGTVTSFAQCGKDARFYGNLRNDGSVGFVLSASRLLGG